MKRKITKGSLLVAALIVVFIAGSALGTLAFYTAEERTHNVITTGDVDIELHEWADEDETVEFPEDGVSGVTPGTKVTKIVEVENTGNSPAWVRIILDVKALSSDGTTALSADQFELDFDTEHWTKGDDGYWYYNRALEPGETTEPLFTGVTFADSMGDDYQGSKITIGVAAQAVQTANNGDTVLEAAGWPEV